MNGCTLQNYVPIGQVDLKRSGRTELRSAQQALGHKNLKTTDIYVRGGVGEKVMPTQ